MCSRINRSAVGSFRAPSVRISSGRFYRGLAQRGPSCAVSCLQLMILLQPLPRLDSAGRIDFPSDIGTALAQWDEKKNFSGGEDVCLGNVVKNNEIATNVRRCSRPFMYVEQYYCSVPSLCMRGHISGRAYRRFGIGGAYSAPIDVCCSSCR